MAEFRVWSCRLAPYEISVMKDRVFRGGEEGLIGYWHMGNATAGEVPRVIAGAGF